MLIGQLIIPPKDRKRRKVSNARGALPLVGALFALWAGAAAGAERVAQLENRHLRVTLSVSESHGQWSLRIQARVGERWRETGRIGIGGVMSTPALVEQYRQRLQTYYPLQKAMPVDIRESTTPAGRILSFRLVREDLWLDMRLGLLGEEPVLVVESRGASRQELLPETSVSFAEPVARLLADTDAEPWRRQEWVARDYRDQGVRVRCRRYMAVWGPETEVVPMVLWPSGDAVARSAQWPRGGLKSVHLHPPFLLAFDAENDERTAHAVQHRALGFASRAERALRIHQPDGKGTQP